MSAEPAPAPVKATALIEVDLAEVVTLRVALLSMSGPFKRRPGLVSKLRAAHVEIFDGLRGDGPA